MRTAAEVADQAARAGGLTIASSEIVPVAGYDLVATRMVFDDPWAAARLLWEGAEDDAADPIVRDWALRMLAACAGATGDPGPTPSAETADLLAQTIQENVQRTVKFVHEPKETFQAARVTIALGAGDCDCQARLVYALARAASLPVDLVFFEVLENGVPVPAHAVCLLGTSDGPCWAETTLPAFFGEHPIDAFERVRDSLPDDQNPFLQPPEPGTLQRVGLGFLGLEFVTPQDVRDYKAELNTHVTSLDADMVACAKADPTGAKIDTATLDRWNQFVATWRDFMASDPSVWNAGGQGRLANNYAHSIDEWETLLSSAGCTLSGPRIVLPAGDPVVGTIKTVAIAAAVIAGAFAVYEVAPLLRGARRRR